jgi:SAM-dependent methyltransferase
MPASPDPYADFAQRYDRFTGGFGEHDPQVVAFYRNLFGRNQVRSVLDCACGTGRDLHLFHTLGCQVVGSDISEAMLAQAQENLEGTGLRIRLRRVDYRQLPHHFDQRFDAVVCVSSSILHMPDEGETLRAFRSMRAVLRRGGILVLTQGTTDRQWREKPRFILAVNEREYSRLFVIDYLGQGARYNVLDIVHGEQDAGLEVWSVEYPRMLLRDDQERLLGAAGFQRIQFYGSYRFEPYDKESSRLLIAVAHNPGKDLPVAPAAASTN